jgi:tRNA G18 (ribose-2'-O)-methylase SpoU
MFTAQPLISFDAPELEPYRTLKRPLEHQLQGIFVAEGEKIVRRLLDSPYEVISMLLTSDLFEDLKSILATRPEHIQVYLAEKKQFEAWLGFSMYKGILAIGRIPAPKALEEILAACRQPYLLVAADGITSAENLGALVRNCAAFGAQALLVGHTGCSPFLRRAVRNSMGAILRIPAVEKLHLPDAFAALRARGIHSIAAHPHADHRSLTQVDFTRDCCLVFGSEGQGIAPDVLAACDEAVAIPMSAEVDSLNVGAAGAVFLYEAARQRRWADTRHPA